MRVMVDSTNIADDPNTAQLVAYYVDGIYATTEAAVRARFPNAIPVGISAIGTNAGIVGDCENGDMTVSGVVIWVLMRRAAGLNPSVYCNQLHTWPAVRQAFQSQNIPEPSYWVADYDNVAVIPTGAVAKQYENSSLTGGHFDKSVVADYWPGVDGVFGPSSGSLGDEMTPEEHQLLVAIYNTLFGGHSPADIAAGNSRITDLEAQVQALKTNTSAEPKTLTITGPIVGTLS